jgi:hypothetical protein
MNLRQQVAIVIVDVVILVELGLAIYWANLDRENFNPVFFKSLFLMLIPTLIAAKLTIKRLRDAPAAEPVASDEPK